MRSGADHLCGALSYSPIEHHTTVSANMRPVGRGGEALDAKICASAGPNGYHSVPDSVEAGRLGVGELYRDIDGV